MRHHPFPLLAKKKILAMGLDMSSDNPIVLGNDDKGSFILSPHLPVELVFAQSSRVNHHDGGFMRFPNGLRIRSDLCHIIFLYVPNSLYDIQVASSFDFQGLEFIE